MCERNDQTKPVSKQQEDKASGSEGSLLLPGEHDLTERIAQHLETGFSDYSLLDLLFIKTIVEIFLLKEAVREHLKIYSAGDLVYMTVG